MDVLDDDDGPAVQLVEQGGVDGGDVAAGQRVGGADGRLRAMSCTGPDGRGVDRSSAPDEAGRARSNPSRKARTRLVLPRPAPPLTSATDPTRPSPRRVGGQAVGWEFRSRSSMDRP